MSCARLLKIAVLFPSAMTRHSYWNQHNPHGVSVSNGWILFKFGCSKECADRKLAFQVGKSTRHCTGVVGLIMFKARIKGSFFQFSKGCPSHQALPEPTSQGLIHFNRGSPQSIIQREGGLVYLSFICNYLFFHELFRLFVYYLIEKITYLCQDYLI